ncbi:MAG: hypothetical protein ACK5YI_06670 [Rhodospirillales bacterium]|jgi:hypothetical protein
MQHYRPTDADRGLVQFLACHAEPQSLIAVAVGVSPPTLRRAYRRELEVCFVIALAAVASALHAAACRRNMAAQIFWLKARAGWSTRDRIEVVASGHRRNARYLLRDAF